MSRGEIKNEYLQHSGRMKPKTCSNALHLSACPSQQRHRESGVSSRHGYTHDTLNTPQGQGRERSSFAPPRGCGRHESRRQVRHRHSSRTHHFETKNGGRPHPGPGACCAQHKNMRYGALPSQQRRRLQGSAWVSATPETHRKLQCRGANVPSRWLWTSRVGVDEVGGVTRHVHIHWGPPTGNVRTRELKRAVRCSSPRTRDVRNDWGSGPRREDFRAPGTEAGCACRGIHSN